jgi:regulator of protease activity HflC (stomatin/prohibitin superfamily)
MVVRDAMGLAASALLQIPGDVGFVGILVAVVLLLLLASAVKIVKEYERGVIFRLGRLIGAKGPGLFFIVPILDKMVKVDLRVITHDVPVQDVMTVDNVPVSVNAVVYYRVLDPEDATVEVENYRVATSQIAQTTLRSVVGKANLDELLSEREKLNDQLQQIIDEATDPWGIKVSMVEIKDVELPQDMRRAMAAQAEAERERRARVISAEGEQQAAKRLRDASQTMAEGPGSMYIRTLQTIQEASSEQGTNTVIPLPIEFLKALNPGDGDGFQIPTPSTGGGGGDEDDGDGVDVEGVDVPPAEELVDEDLPDDPVRDPDAESEVDDLDAADIPGSPVGDEDEPT